MSRFNLDDYEPVADRIAKFYKAHPEGSIITQPQPAPEGEWVFKATVYRDPSSHPWATGFAHEIAGKGHVNTTSALENCETSAIGRALANAGFATTKQRPSREEMAKVEPDHDLRAKLAISKLATVDGVLDKEWAVGIYEGALAMAGIGKIVSAQDYDLVMAAVDRQSRVATFPNNGNGTPSKGQQGTEPFEPPTTHSQPVEAEGDIHAG